MDKPKIINLYDKYKCGKNVNVDKLKHQKGNAGQLTNSLIKNKLINPEKSRSKSQKRPRITKSKI